MFWLDDAPLSLGCFGPMPKNAQPPADANGPAGGRAHFAQGADRKFFEFIEPERAEET
jgi:hypothetical protein